MSTRAVIAVDQKRKPHYLWTPSGPLLKQNGQVHPEAIKEALRIKGVTPTALADEMGVANSTMSQVISGRSESARIKRRIAEITGHSVDVLWPRTNARPVLRRTRAAVAAAQTRAAA